MAQKKLTELSIPELETKYKKTKGIVIGMAIVMIIAVITLIFLAMKSKNYALIAVGFCCLINIFPMTIALSLIKKELNSRIEKQPPNDI